MPGKNLNRMIKKEGFVSRKSSEFFNKFLNDVRMEGGRIKDVYPGRVMKNLGCGRMEVFYTDYTGSPWVTNVSVRGIFQSKGKMDSLGLSTNSVVLIADSGLGGSRQFDIMACLTYKQISELKRIYPLDSRITAYDNTDEAALIRGETDEGGFDIREEVADKSDDDGEVDVDNI